MRRTGRLLLRVLLIAAIAGAIAAIVLKLRRRGAPEWDASAPWETDPLIGNHPIGGFHHMGTTRMADDRRAGVVNANCRVHGVENLFVAGSSVFPTSGWANPTLTILALALRLGDHLDARVLGR